MILAEAFHTAGFLSTGGSNTALLSLNKSRKDRQTAGTTQKGLFNQPLQLSAGDACQAATARPYRYDSISYQATAMTRGASLNTAPAVDCCCVVMLCCRHPPQLQAHSTCAQTACARRPTLQGRRNRWPGNTQGHCFADTNTGAMQFGPRHGPCSFGPSQATLTSLPAAAPAGVSVAAADDDDASQAQETHLDQYELIVVGSGNGACAFISKYLTATQGQAQKVLVIEEGQSFLQTSSITHQANWTRSYSEQSIFKLHTTTTGPKAGNRPIISGRAVTQGGYLTAHLLHQQRFVRQCSRRRAQRQHLHQQRFVRHCCIRRAQHQARKWFF